MVTGFSDQGRYCNEHSKLIDRNPGVSRLAVTFQFVDIDIAETQIVLERGLRIIPQVVPTRTRIPTRVLDAASTAST